MSADLLDAVYEALEHRYRRYALAALDERASPLSMTDLAVEVAARERGVTVTEVGDDRAENVRARLHHRHVPKLAEEAFVDYDRDSRVVELTDAGRQFLSTLALFAGEA